MGRTKIECITPKLCGVQYHMGIGECQTMMHLIPLNPVPITVPEHGTSYYTYAEDSDEYWGPVSTQEFIRNPPQMPSRLNPDVIEWSDPMLASNIHTPAGVFRTTRSIDGEFMTISHYNRAGQRSCLNGPAVEVIRVTDSYVTRREWRVNSELHREGDSPAYLEWSETVDGQILVAEWYVSGLAHRDHGPAGAYWNHDGSLGSLIWKHQDQVDREDGPAIEHYYEIEGTSRSFIGENTYVVQGEVLSEEKFKEYCFARNYGVPEQDAFDLIHRAS